MWPPQEPQPLPGAHLALTFPGAPSMPAGCHSKSKSYKQNEEKSLISIYSNEPCNNANHKSRSHCYSISVSYPSPQHFPRVSRFLAAFTSPFPAWGPGAGREGTVPTTWGAPGPQSPPPSPRCPLNLGWPLPCSQTPRSSITRGRIRAGSCVPRQQPLIRAGIYAARWALLNGKKLSPELISVPGFNPGARLPVSSPGAEFSAGERRGPIPMPRPP